jgi:16S rRNA (cytidine1402-2'-O)-methyltransferase
MGIEKPLMQIAMHEMGKHADKTAYFGYFKSIEQGKNIGVISEAGCPGVADPGAEIVSLAHSKNIEVVPLIGPSSILLALMARGFNGQSFAFVGYLPIDKTERIKRLKYLETTADKMSQTQLFIETPFRNNQVFKDILENCKADTYVSLAVDLTMPTQFIKSKTVSNWKKEIPDLHKRPCVFSIYCK